MPAMGRCRLRFCQANKRANQFGESRLSLRGRFLDEDAKIGGHQFIAASSCMQLPAERAQFFNHGLFDEVMDVFGFGSIEPRFFLFGAILDAIQCRERFLHFVRVQECPGLAAL